MKHTPTIAFEILHSLLPTDKVPGPHDYKAPHALRGTPPRKRYPRATRPKRLFKGHRP